MPEFTISMAEAAPEPAVGGSRDAKAILQMRCEMKAVLDWKMDYGKLTSHDVGKKKRADAEPQRRPASFQTAESRSGVTLPCLIR